MHSILPLHFLSTRLSTTALVCVFAGCVFSVEAKAAQLPPASAFSAIAAASVAREKNVEVITRSDLKNLLSFETEKQLLGCDAESCLAEISDALGADVVLFIDVNGIGASIVLSLTLYTSQARVVGRRVVNDASATALAQKVPALVSSLLGGYLRTLPRKKSDPPTKVFINFKDAPPPPAAVVAPDDVQKMIEDSRRAAQKTIADATARAERLQKEAIAAAHFPPAGYLGDVADLAYCIESAVPRLLQSERRYRSWRDDDGNTPPTCKERYVSYGLYEGYEHAVDACQAAIKRSPQELKQEAEELTAAVVAALPVVAEAEKYYDDEDYIDDDCAAGKRLHPLLLKAFQGIRTTLKAASAKFDDVALARAIASRRGSSAQKSVAVVVQRVVAAAALAPLVFGDAVSPSQHRALLGAVADAKVAMAAAARASSTSSSADRKSAWKATVKDLKDEARWWKLKHRALKKSGPLDASSRRGSAYDPTEIRMRAFRLARSLASTFPPVAPK